MVSEIVTDADEVEGNYVDSKDEGHHGRGKLNNHKSQSDVPGEKMKISRVRKEKEFC